MTPEHKGADLQPAASGWSRRQGRGSNDGGGLLLIQRLAVGGIRVLLIGSATISLADDNAAVAAVATTTPAAPLAPASIESTWAARPASNPSLAEEADPIDNHFTRGQALLDQGEYAKAVLEFEQVLRYDNLPPDQREQAEIYARAAQDYQQGRRLSVFGYTETGAGFYRENHTRTTNALGGDPARDGFWNARIGGGLGYIATDAVSVDASLDYQYRYYDDTDRRDDSDLRWNARLTQSLDAGSQSIGVRGRASYRGGDGYRQDYGLFVNRAFILDPDNEILLEGEIRAREYPRGGERNRSRDIAQAWLGWTRALMDGRASATLTLTGGREWATHGRAGGDQTIYGAQIDWGIDINERLSAFLFGLWEHNGTHEDIPYENTFGDPGRLRPDLDIYELGGGLTYAFAPDWSIRPEVLYIRDEGDAEFSDYSSTEIWINVRKSF
ncbi:MAG: tetratricopeptide repeat protein [Lamprobacter sp.]|uniref:tetratricopeptide repeat protein n=1 Tax=Lamprobacter sp. TaxID=3100796 RepID=UPI002B259A85|nr:tetratricopeptide repeat protein [Lamprobacter sp.]MEA3640652.1 tetratricopeptide repeat protein [Lamprobacter sp.]